MAAESPHADPRIAERLERFAVAAMSAGTLRERVAAAARQLLAAGRRADTAAVAHRVGMSQRSLQRRLRDEHATFRAVRDAAVREAFEALLANPHLKLAAVAQRIGFADGAALAKAVKRWTGCSPAEYRKRLAGTAQAPSAPGPRRVGP